MKTFILSLCLVLLLVQCGTAKEATRDVFNFTGSFSGKWKMEKVEFRNGGQSASCQNATLNITQTDSTLLIAARKFNCGIGASNITFDALNLSLNDGKLSDFFGEVGDIGEGYIDIEIVRPGQASWRLRIIEDNGSYTYRESISGGAVLSADLTK